MKKTPTVTIGIPAHNEAENILGLLDSIVGQNRSNFLLQKIIVICDGCTDTTVELVKNYGQSNPLVELINDGERLGKAQRLNQLYKLNSSDLVINLDGDILLSNAKTLHKLISPFANPDILLTSGNNLPVSGDNFIQKLTAASDLLWHEVRTNYKQGQNIYNSSGCICAIRKSFAGKFKYSKAIVADQQFIYLSAVGISRSAYHFVKDAIVYYRSADNLHDFYNQATRSQTERNQIIQHFGESITWEYMIPWRYKLRAILKRILVDPLFTLSTLILAISLRLKPVRLSSSLYSLGIWEIASSTKKRISMV